MLTCALVTKTVGMTSFWAGTVADFLAASPAHITGALAEAQIRHFRVNETQQLRAWEATIAMLRASLADAAFARDWHVLLEYPMLRLGRRPDVILLTDRAILVLEIKAGAAAHTSADRRQVEDYAIDLHDFHAGSCRHPVVPILVAEHAPTQHTPLPLLFGVTQVIDANAATLRPLLHALAVMPRSETPLDAASWQDAPYRPVPTIVDAACMLYARHGVADIREARGDATNLRTTTDAILAEIAAACAGQYRVIIFVTGIPGAGKTLCGLNTVFGTSEQTRGTYLTGNPTLVHVLREALSRDASVSGARTNPDRPISSAIQRLPDFRSDYVLHPDHVPPEQVVVIDESQRCRSRDYAVAKTRDKLARLTDSEPAHLLEAMARHDGFAAMVCLVGSGQEIHTGEGGLAEWGRALREAAARGRGWQIRAAPDILSTTDPRQRLGPVPDMHTSAALHLDVAVRQLRSTVATAWVDHVLAGDAQRAGELAHEAGVPFHLTRDLDHMRAWLRSSARGLRRAGLLASSGARRLRAEGLGAELPHMDAAAVAHWFLDRYPDDVRASDALETLATEFSAQGLELDYVGLCWDGDLVREPGRTAWRVRSFRGTRWQYPAGAEAIANQLNTYRVLLTRARYDTVIFVPRGDAIDPTRSPSVFNGIAAFLTACGAKPLGAPAPAAARQTPACAPLLL